jgi:hypothetical protein
MLGRCVSSLLKDMDGLILTVLAECHSYCNEQNEKHRNQCALVGTSIPLFPSHWGSMFPLSIPSINSLLEFDFADTRSLDVAFLIPAPVDGLKLTWY